MIQITPPPTSEVQEAVQEEMTQEEFHFILGDLEPIAPPKKTFPAILKQAIRPMLFGAIGIHALLLFMPLSSPQQTKPKETAEPVKLARLSDKVLVKSMPKVKIAAAPKKASLPKVTVASTNPVIVNLPEPEKPKTDEIKPEDKKTEQKKPEDKKTDGKPSDSKVADGKQSDKGIDPSKVDPKNRTIDENAASKLDAESQKFGSVISALRSTLNPGEAEAEADANLLDNPAPFFSVKPPPQGNSLISNQEVEDVEANLKGQFTEEFTKKGNYGGGVLYEAKIGGTKRYVSLVKTNQGKGVMVFLWEKSPM